MTNLETAAHGIALRHGITMEYTPIGEMEGTWHPDILHWRVTLWRNGSPCPSKESHISKPPSLGKTLQAMGFMLGVNYNPDDFVILDESGKSLVRKRDRERQCAAAIRDNAEVRAWAGETLARELVRTFGEEES